MNEWGYVNWFPEHGAHLVHPEDVAGLGRGVQGLVGTVSAGEDGWKAFRYGNHIVRLKGEIIHPCKAPAFSYGESVETIHPRSSFRGEVRGIQWHFQREQALFLVGPKRKRYLQHELRSAQPAVQPDGPASGGPAG